MATPPPENSPTSKPSPYRLPVVLGAAGVLLLVLGFIIPGWGWLAWLGFVLFSAAAGSLWVWFLSDWRPTLVKTKEHDEDPWHILPPPTREDRS